VKHGRHFAAPDVARFCAVDLKTVHAWAKKGSLPHERSRGGQLRFRRTDLVAFLRAHGFPFPKLFAREKPLVLGIGALADAIVAALDRSVVFVHEPSPVRALVGLRELAPDALMLGATLGFSRALLVREISEVEPRLVVACTGASMAEVLSFRDAGAKVVGLLAEDGSAGDVPFVAALREVLGFEARQG
jgi:excisionase family DNA binding protein